MYEICCVWYKYCYTCMFWGAIGMVNLLPDLHIKLVFISVNKLGLLQTTDCHIFLFNPVCQMVSFDGWVEFINSVNTDTCVVILAFSCFCCLRIWLWAANSRGEWLYKVRKIHSTAIRVQMLKMAVFCSA
jgi:hypothetical protein